MILSKTDASASFNYSSCAAAPELLF